MTGKEIIDKAIVQSQGKWRPSPGLIYPMLGRQLDEGLIAELENGRYKITQKGLDMTGDLQSFNNIFEHHGFGGQKIEKSFDLLSYGYRYIIYYVSDSFSSSFSVSSNCSPSSFGILLKLLLN